MARVEAEQSLASIHANGLNPANTSQQSSKSGKSAKGKTIRILNSFGSGFVAVSVYLTVLSQAHKQSTERFPMIAIRQIHEHLADVIEVPPELRNRKTEVIFLAMDSAPRDSRTEDPESTASDNNNRSAVEFFGSIPDFPERTAQGECDSRLEMS